MSSELGLVCEESFSQHSRVRLLECGVVDSFFPWWCRRRQVHQSRLPEMLDILIGEPQQFLYAAESFGRFHGSSLARPKNNCKK